MAIKTRILDPDELLELPVPDDLLDWELVDGQPVPVMPASPIHGEFIAEVVRRLANHVIEHGLAGKVWSDVGCVLGLERDPTRTRSPDVSYTEHHKLEGADPERLFRGVPDLAIEIDLTSGKKPGGQQRIVEYLEAGARLVWSIDPHSRTAMAYWPDGSARLFREDETLDAGAVVPGFTLPLAELFG